MLVSSHLLSEAFVVQDSDQNLFDLPAEVENEQQISETVKISIEETI